MPPDQHEDYDCLEDALEACMLEGDACPACGGTGEVPDNGTNFGECEDCNGTGELDCNN